MSLQPGVRIGPYEVIEAIGAGGMGEVYRAKDTKLKREVAIKVLPAALVADAERLARFQREAEVLAALNHPNIAQVYGLEESESRSPGGQESRGPEVQESTPIRALVMELVEGDDLSHRIAHGAMPVEDALPIAMQIAGALEAAHEQGIVHRDLKPANIKVRADGTVKVLDFGLAKAMAQDGGGPTSSPTALTLTSPAMTQMGMILGTAAYMAPEQARGKPVDRRADVWAFGAVLFEMLTGRRAFDGEDVSLTLSQVLQREPDFDALPEAVPPAVRVCLKRCLQKDPKQRLGDMQSVRLALAGAFETAGPVDAAMGAPASAAARVLPWAVAALVVALGVALWAPWRAPGPADRPLVRANLDLPGYVGGFSNLALSPDGTRIAYVARGEGGRTRLITRLLAESEGKALDGTDGATWPFFSPDGQWIGFGAGGQVKKVLALGGAPVKLADAPGFAGGSWDPGGFIVVTVDVSGEMRLIPETGGAGETLVAPWSGGGPYPQVLPGAKMVTFNGSDDQGPAVKILSLETKEVSTLIPGALGAQYLSTGGANGYLAYHNRSTVLAAPFDPVAGAFRGSPIPMLEDVIGAMGVSSTGDLLYQVGVVAADGWPLQWLRPDGTSETLLEAEGNYTYPRVSPDGNLLVVTVDGDRPPDTYLLVYDWRNDRRLALTMKGQATGGAVWTPDSRHVMWATPPIDGVRRFRWKRADGSGDVHTLVESRVYIHPGAIAPDGKHLAMNTVSGAAPSLDVSVAPLEISPAGEMTLGEAEPVVSRPGTEVWPTFSPDGRWIAYFSDESGTYEVYVQRFPGGSGHRKVSEGGGIYPKWSSNGRQLLYAAPGANQIMVVDYQGDGDAFVASKPRPWSTRPMRVAVDDFWNVDPTGDRVVGPPSRIASDFAGPPKVAYLLNFFDELRRRAPVRK